MPVTIQPTVLRYKNNLGQFQSADCLKGQDANLAVVAPQYEDLTFPVLKDQLCIHYEVLYKAKQNIAVAEDWTAGHWKETTVDEELADIGAKIGTKANYPSTAPNVGDFVIFGSNGNLVDAGIRPDHYKIFRFQYQIPANSAAVELEWMGPNTVWMDQNLLSDNARVIGYYADQWKYYKNIHVEYETSSFTTEMYVSVSILPGAAAGTLELYIADTILH